MADPPQQASGADPRRLWFAPPDGAQRPRRG